MKCFRLLNLFLVCLLVCLSVWTFLNQKPSFTLALFALRCKVCVSCCAVNVSVVQRLHLRQPSQSSTFSARKYLLTSIWSSSIFSRKKKPKTKTKAKKHPRKQNNNKKQPLVTFMKLVADFLFERGNLICKYFSWQLARFYFLSTQKTLLCLAYKRASHTLT